MRITLLLSCFLLSSIAFAKDIKKSKSLKATGDITVSELYDNNVIEAYGTDEWSFTPSVTGIYRFNLTDLQSDLGVWIYDENNDVDMDCDMSDERDNEICEIELQAGVSYYVDVDEYTDVDSSYDLLVDQIQ